MPEGRQNQLKIKQVCTLIVDRDHVFGAGNCVEKGASPGNAASTRHFSEGVYRTPRVNTNGHGFRESKVRHCNYRWSGNWRSPAIPRGLNWGRHACVIRFAGFTRVFKQVTGGKVEFIVAPKVRIKLAR